MIKILHCHWLNKDKYNLGKLNLTMLWVIVKIYPKLKERQGIDLLIQKN